MSIIKSEGGGFTIVELVVAIGVLGIFIISVVTLMINTDRTGQRTRDVAVVNSYAENKIESLRSAGYLGLPASGDITAELPNELKTPRSASLNIGAAPSSTSVKKVELSITYNEQGTPRTYSYTTFIGELGVGQN